MPQLNLPSPLDDYWQSHADLQQAYKKSCSVPYATFQSRFIHEAQAKSGLRYFVVTPDGPYDKHDAVVISLPFASPLWALMVVRIEALFYALPKPRQIIVFAHNTWKDRSYTLTPTEKRQVNEGDFSPIAQKQLEALKEMQLRTCSIVGYSLGAALGARLWRLATDDGSIRCLAVGFFEPPNVMRRSFKEISRAFAQGGNGRLHRARKDSGIPGIDTIHSLETKKDRLLDIPALLGFVVSTLMSVNRAITQACRGDSFRDDVLTAVKTAACPVTLAVAEKSLVSPKGHMKETADKLEALGVPVRFVCVEHYGHEMGDNVTAHAVLCHMAIA